jgi:hypothetical protein
MATEKDRLGEKLRDAERGREDEYFARRDRELIAKLRDSKGQESEQALREIARMRCPKCGANLHSRTLREVTVDECPACHGIWLDNGELELLEKQEEGWLIRWLRGERDT